MPASFSKKLALFLVCLLLLANLLIGILAFRRESRQTNPDARSSRLEQLGTFFRAFRLIQSNYVDPGRTDSQSLMDNALHGMAGELDPYSAYLPPRENTVWQELGEGWIGGVGVTLEIQNGFPVIISTTHNGPAYCAGLLCGDKILTIDDHPTFGKDNDVIRCELRGEPGTPITLTVLRQDEPAPLTFTFSRGKIQQASIINACLLDNTTIGYFRILVFSDHTAKDVYRTIRALLVQGAQSLILDLRGCPGGLMPEAFGVCNIFLPADVTLVSIEERSQTRNQTIRSWESPDKLPFSLRLVLLIDQGSASAAELTAGCLQDYQRATLVGAKSYGKGCYQSLLPLGKNTALKLTSGLYYTPHHQIVEKNGLTPDLSIPMDKDDYQALSQVHDFKQTIPLDKQLQAAIRILSMPQEEGTDNNEPQEAK